MEPIFEFFKFWHFEVSKNSKKTLHVYSNVFYSNTNYFVFTEQSEEFRIFYWSLCQIWKFVNLRSLKYTIIRIDFLHTCRIHHYLHPRFFFGTLNYQIQKSLKNGIHRARPPYWHKSVWWSSFMEPVFPSYPTTYGTNTRHQAIGREFHRFIHTKSISIQNKVLIILLLLLIR
jgi:hypothetical protein